MIIRLHKYYLLFLIAFPLLSMAQDNDALQFVENQGQFEKEVLFRVQLNTGYVFLERNAITFKVFNEMEYRKAHQHLHKDTLVKNPIIHGHVFKYKFYNCQNNIGVNGQKPFKEKFNYFLNGLLMFQYFQRLFIPMYMKELI